MRPKLLDLFCGAGGCSVGYHRAGFDVTGVDIESHPDYPYDFVQADAMTILQDTTLLPLDQFDVIHASPPCQGSTTMSNRARAVGSEVAAAWPKLIAPVRRQLQVWAAGSPGRVYIIENVPGARSEMRAPFILHGGMFGLGVDRPRLFESNAHIQVYDAPRVGNPVGVYGKLDGRRLFTRADGSTQNAARTLQQGQTSMGIDWMDWDDLREAIPPDYCEFIGSQLVEQLEAAA